MRRWMLASVIACALGLVATQGAGASVRLGCVAAGLGPDDTPGGLVEVTQRGGGETRADALSFVINGTAVTPTEVAPVGTLATASGVRSTFRFGLPRPTQTDFTDIARLVVVHGTGPDEMRSAERVIRLHRSFRGSVGRVFGAPPACSLPPMFVGLRIRPSATPVVSSAYASYLVPDTRLQVRCRTSSGASCTRATRRAPRFGSGPGPLGLRSVTIGGLAYVLRSSVTLTVVAHQDGYVGRRTEVTVNTRGDIVRRRNGCIEPGGDRPWRRVSCAARAWPSTVLHYR